MKSTVLKSALTGLILAAASGTAWADKADDTLRVAFTKELENVDSYLKNEQLGGEYHGYASCPIVISNKEMLLAEFDYSMEMTPSFPTWLFDPAKPHRRYWHLKRYGLPFLYWNLMLKGIA